MLPRPIASRIFIVALAAILFPNEGRSELQGIIVRDVVDPFGTGDTDSIGIASDGMRLFVARTDGGVRVADLQTLQTQQTFDLALQSLHGLEYQNGLLYATVRELNGQLFQPSRVYRISSQTGQLLSFFDAPEDGLTELAFAQDGLLYAADGYRNRGASGGKVHVFSDANGALLSTAVTRTISDPGFPDRPEIIGGQLVEWLLDGRMLFAGSNDNPFFSGIDDQTLLRNEDLVIQGLPEEEIRGSEILGNRLFLMTRGFGGGSTLVNRFLEVHLIPEPATAIQITVVFLAMSLYFIPTRRRRLRSTT
jgi:hypothetical protein